MEAALKLQPYLCFERCDAGFKESPINVKRKGVLHSSWAKFTHSVRLLQVAEQGMYMNTNLERVRDKTRYVLLIFPNTDEHSQPNWITQHSCLGFASGARPHLFIGAVNFNQISCLSLADAKGVDSCCSILISFFQFYFTKTMERKNKVLVSRPRLWRPPTSIYSYGELQPNFMPVPCGREGCGFLLFDTKLVLYPLRNHLESKATEWQPFFFFTYQPNAPNRVFQSKTAVESPTTYTKTLYSHI